MTDFRCSNILKLVNYEESQLNIVYDLLNPKVEDLRLNPNNVLLFSTEWVAPNRLIKTISKQFPTITFLLYGEVKDEFITSTITLNGIHIEAEELKVVDRNNSTIFASYEG